MNHLTLQRIAGVSGILFFLMIVVEIIFSPNVGNPGDSAQTVMRLTSHNGSTALGFVVVSSLEAIPLLVFVVALCSIIRSHDAAGDVLTFLAWGGAFLGVGIDAMAHAATAALVYKTAARGSLATVQALFSLRLMASILLWVPFALMLAAIAVSVFRTRSLPRWIGGAALLPALIGLVSTAGIVDPAGGVALLSILALFLTVLWVLATSIALMVRSPLQPWERPAEREPVLSATDDVDRG